ncbi:hypothetical protein AGMMS49975_23630 [Clostridia bacterium]|nr:hypothetical protein AGMMS49975_23630 [Clostridia bacterium]
MSRYNLTTNDSAKYTENWLSAQRTTPLTKLQLKECLAVLQTAFPTVVRGYNDAEYDAMVKLWGNIFRNVPQDILQEAILRFIINDRKGFFPTPGQIVGHAQQIIAEQKAEKDRIAFEIRWSKICAEDELIAKGEHCGTCKFCRHELKVPMRHKYSRDKETYMLDALYCQNPQSYKYEGDNGGHGTANKIRCDFYEPQDRRLAQRGTI